MPYLSPTADQSVSELKSQLELEREGEPFVVHRDGDATQVLTLLARRERITIGREEDADVWIAGDKSVSRLHAELKRIDGAWVVSDDGLSRNGTYVNGERLTSRRRLADRDLVRIGDTGLLFRDPEQVKEAAIGELPAD